MSIEVKIEGTERIVALLDVLSIELKREIDRTVEREAIRVEGYAKEYSPIDTGRLRSSIHFGKISEFKYKVEDGVHYGCVFSAHTQVNCGKNNVKTIGKVKIGDKVLTQDGLLHEVIGTRRFLATEKPELVEIETEYRSDRTHKLILTTDHKVMRQSRGCNEWVKAGDLKEGDILYSPFKKNYNIRTAPKIVSNCQICGKELIVRKSEHEKYNRGTLCSSKKCRKLLNLRVHTGKKRSNISKQRMSESAIRRFELYPESHPNKIMAKKGFVTGAERQVAEWLISLGINFEREVKFGKHFVDFYLPERGVIIEADGAFWHQDQKKDIQRDREILDSAKELVHIFHIHFTEKRFSKKIEYNPMPTVFYIQCNDSIHSFVHPEIFKTIKVLKVRKFIYKNESRNLGQKGKYLYDLTVDTTHSFVASGILISNSYQEFGTSRMPAHPFMIPAIYHSLPEYEAELKTILDKIPKV